MTEDNVGFIDNILLEDIRKKLWSVDGKSRVSIMIGAGFSRNASKIDSSLNSMALWSDLKNVMIDSLGNEEKMHQFDVLELADIYEKEFGIISLENLLKSQVPDENYEPNKLYTQLLSLPFSDVFTTNYDTLLERASKNIFDRRYQIIYDIHDIPGSKAPRIVKLHGSFPSHRPFVFSKTSYEKYPTESAPFVNMVQQSIMETTLVLIGFSGDDPNFAKWIEWVSVSLGEHRPNIYLIGLGVDKNNEILKKNNIKLLDFQYIYENTPEKYSLFFNDLFVYLSKKPSLDKRQWPHTKYPWFSLDKKISTTELISLLVKNRETYPGWLVMPYKIKNRHLMSKYISSYFALLKKENILEKKIQLSVEIIWLLRTFRIPLYHWQQKLLKNLLEETEENKTFEDDIIKIELFLLREGRLDESHDYSDYAIRLEKRTLSKEFENELFFQEMLRCLNTIGKKEIINKLDNWKISNNSLEYQLKKACILIKIHEYDEGLSIVKDVLKSARRIQSISTNNYFCSFCRRSMFKFIKKISKDFIIR